MAASSAGSPEDAAASKAKFLIDDIVLDESAEVAAQFGCAVCLHIASEPVVQTPCGHVYCKECISLCKICPLCREPFEPAAVKLLSEVNKMGMRFMHAIKVRCPYAQQSCHPEPPAGGAGSTAANVTDGDDKDVSCSAEESATRPLKRLRLMATAGQAEPQCSWKGVYGDLLAKHLGECPRHPIPCPNECGEILFRADVVAHRMVCERGFEECSICGDRVPPGGLAVHRADKAQLHVEVLEAKLAEQKVMASQHDSVIQRLGRLEDQVKTLAKTSHVTTTTKTRAEELKAEVRAALREQVQTEVVWRIAGVARLLRDFPRGQMLASPDFSLLGVGRWYFELYPNGKNEDHECYLFIHCRNPGVRATLKLSICGATTLLGELTYGSFGHGTHFPKPCSSNTEGDAVEVRAELIKVCWVGSVASAG